MSLCNKSKGDVGKPDKARNLNERWQEGKVNDFSVVKRKGRPKKR